MSKVNYRHLYYFWVVAKEGGFARASERLDMAIQTISAQVKSLEQDLGYALFKPAGRRLALTDAGQAAFLRAETIFQLGESIPEAVAEASSLPVVRLAVGISDGLSKLAIHSLLQPVMDTPSLKLVCHEGEVEQLTSELALHELDLVLACQPPARSEAQRLVSDRLMVSPVDWYGPASLVRPLQGEPLAVGLQRVPVLLPTPHAALRARIDRWFEAEAVTPRVVAEFEDSALMALFASQGMGVFPLAALGAESLAPSLRLRRLGRGDGLYEEIHGIRSRRGLHHPLVLKVISAASVPSVRF